MDGGAQQGGGQEDGGEVGEKGRKRRSVSFARRHGRSRAFEEERRLASRIGQRPPLPQTEQETEDFFRGGTDSFAFFLMR